MSTATATASYKTLSIAHCQAHPGNACVEIALSPKPEGDTLNFVFTTFRHANEPNQIGIIEDLLLECKAYRAPSGYDVMDHNTVHFHYRGAADLDILFDAKSRLQDRLKKTMALRNATHRRDPETRLVYPR